MSTASLSKFFSGLTAKIILAFLLVSLIPLSLLAFLNNRNTQTVLIENAEQSLSAAASQTAASIDTFFGINLDSIKVEAQLPALVAYLNLSPDQRAGNSIEEAALATLRELRRKNRIFISSYALLDSTGKNILDTDTASIGQDASQQKYFQKPIETGLAQVSHITLANPDAENSSQSWNDTILYFSSPVRDERAETIGVLRMRYKASTLQQLAVANNGLAGEKSYAMLLDENYIRLAHGTAPELIFKSVVPLKPERITTLQATGRLPDLPSEELSTNLPDLAEGLANIAFEPNFSAKLATTGDSINLIVAKELKTRPWLVIFTQPQEVFLAPINAQTERALYLAIAIGAVIVAVAFVVGRLLTNPLIDLTQAVTHFTAGDLEIRATIKSDDETGVLAHSFNTMAEQVGSLLKNLEERTYELEAEIIERERAEAQLVKLSAIERELMIARQIQQSILPPAKPEWADLDVVCYSTPAREVGGDLYVYHLFADSIEKNGGGKFIIAVGDVSGKGPPAALLMAVSMASFRAVVERELAPASFLIRLDKIITGYTTTIRQNCALIYAEITIPRAWLYPSETALNGQSVRTLEANHGATLRVANAGCMIPLVKRVDGNTEWVDIGGLPLGTGLDVDFGYQELSLNLSKGDLIILTSDGIVEATNLAGNMLGFDDLMQLVSSGPMSSAEDMVEHIKQGVFAFVGEAELHDDMTVVVIRM